MALPILFQPLLSLFLASDRLIHEREKGPGWGKTICTLLATRSTDQGWWVGGLSKGRS